jgi:hypothetical protein
MGGRTVQHRQAKLPTLAVECGPSGQGQRVRLRLIQLFNGKRSIPMEPPGYPILIGCGIDPNAAMVVIREARFAGFQVRKTRLSVKKRLPGKAPPGTEGSNPSPSRGESSANLDIGNLAGAVVVAACPIARPQSRLPRRSHRVAIATNVRRGLGEQFGEPVPPRLARNSIIESTFEVGRRFRCATRVDCGELDPAAVIRPEPGEWHPRMPERLDEEELADWRAGRKRSIRRSTFSAAKLSDGALNEARMHWFGRSRGCRSEFLSSVGHCPQARASGRHAC